MNQQKTGQRVRCPHCDKTFCKTNNMTRHVKSVHNEHYKQFRYKCSLCDKTFGIMHRRNFRRHFKDKHSKDPLKLEEAVTNLEVVIVSEGILFLFFFFNFLTNRCSLSWWGTVVFTFLLITEFFFSASRTGKHSPEFEPTKEWTRRTLPTKCRKFHWSRIHWCRKDIINVQFSQRWYHIYILYRQRVLNITDIRLSFWHDQFSKFRK